jgi:iron complex transport system substrate-binding protein
MRQLLLSLLLLLCPLCHAEITVSDFVGRQVTLEQPARRIVALAPHIVENLYSAGAGEALVGVVSYSDYPASARDIPRVGSYKAFSLETILALQPDLVVMWASGNGMTTLDDLAALKVPVYVSEPRHLDDIGRAIRDYGKLAGSEPAAEREALRIDGAINQLLREHEDEESISVLYQVWHEPLQTLNGKHLISAVIELCGGYNIFADAVSLAPKVSLESVLQRNPDAIVASGMDIARPEWLDLWLNYPSLSAVQNQALFFVHPDHIQRPTARVLLGAQALCHQLDSVPRRRWIE